MKEFTVCQHVRTGYLIAIKEGWSWPGFFFSYVWIVVSQLWEVLYTTLFIITILRVHFWLVDNHFHTQSLIYFSVCLGIFVLAVPFILGVYGNRLLKRKYCYRVYLLDNNRYVPRGVVSASNKDGAIALFRSKE